MQYILIDSSVVFRLIHHRWLKSQALDLDKFVAANLTEFMGGDWLGMIKQRETQFVWLCDSKPYWRYDYLAKQGIEYKGGRKPSPESLIEISISAQAFLKGKEYRLWRAYGYEADDLAALFVRQSEGREIILATVDKDWKGLICDRVSWFSLVQYRGQKMEHRYCNSLDSLNDWLQHKSFPTVDHPSQLWGVLSQYGDSSDGLPRGCDLSAIDLLNPPPEYRLWDRMVALYDSGRRVPGDAVQKARQWLASIDQSPLIQEYRS